MSGPVEFALAAAVVGLAGCCAAESDARLAGFAALDSVAAAGEARVPLLRAHGLLYLEVERSGRQPLLALLDSGANASAIDPRHAVELPLLEVVDVIGTTGTLQSELVELTGLRLGALALPALRATRRDLGGLLPLGGRSVDLILGSDALAPFAVTLDFARSELRACATCARRDARAESVELALDEGIPAIPAQIGGIETWLRLDTGASLFSSAIVYVNVPPAIASALRARHPGAPEVERLSGAGAAGEPVPLPVREMRGARIGPLELERVRVIEQPAVGYFAREGAKGFVGVNFLEKLGTVTLDYPGRALVLPIPHEPPVPTEGSGRDPASASKTSGTGGC